MRDHETAFLSATELAELVRTKEVSPVELTELYLSRIEAIDPSLGAYLTVAADQALEAARASEARLAEAEPPPFLGVPISIKDLADTAGIRTTCATAAWKDRVPDRDDWSVSKLKAAGFIVIGKTNTPEFGNSVVTEPAAYHPCRNPWDQTRSTGGSSGGAAAALAAGLCPVSHGTDGGGSIRMPAAACGVVGLKPARGRISTAPRPPSFNSTAGPLARTVRDAAALLDVMAGYSTGDPHWAPPAGSFAAAAAEPSPRLRIAVTPDTWEPDIDVAPDNRRAVERTAELLAELGHEVTTACPEAGGLNQRSLPIKAAELAATPDLPAFEELEPIVGAFARMGAALSAVDYVRAVDDVTRRARDIVAFFDGYDVLVTPTLATKPPLIGSMSDAPLDVSKLRDAGTNAADLAALAPDPERLRELRSMSVFTNVWNLTGQPAMSLPLFADGDGLPIGIQIVGRPADEVTLLRLATELERTEPWADRRPPVARTG